MSENALLPNGRSLEWAWRSILGILENDVANVTFKRWIRPSKLMAYEDGIFTIGLPDEYTIRWWEDRLSSLVVRQLRGICNGPTAVRFIISDGLQLKEEPRKIVRVSYRRK